MRRDEKRSESSRVGRFLFLFPTPRRAAPERRDVYYERNVKCDGDASCLPFAAATGRATPRQAGRQADRQTGKQENKQQETTTPPAANNNSSNDDDDDDDGATTERRISFQTTAKDSQKLIPKKNVNSSISSSSSSNNNNKHLSEMCHFTLPRFKWRPLFLPFLKPPRRCTLEEENSLYFPQTPSHDVACL